MMPRNEAEQIARKARPRHGPSVSGIQPHRTGHKKAGPKAGFAAFPCFHKKIIGRGKRIRTSGPCLPKTVLYQAELFPDRASPKGAAGQERAYKQGFRGTQGVNLRRHTQPPQWTPPPAIWPRAPGHGTSRPMQAVLPTRVPTPADLPAPTAHEHWEWQYLRLMARIWHEGDERIDRTGVGTRALFGAEIRCPLSDAQMPLATTKRVFWKTATREFLWFLTGETNIRPLLAQNVQIWTDWPLARYRRETGHDITREAFTTQILEDADFAAKWGDLGPVYGAQWTNWPAYDALENGLHRRRPQGINQITQLIEGLRHNPHSRRHIVEGWNVAELDAMALPPCHKTYQFHVTQGQNGKPRLSLLLYQRSADLALGVPFNLWSAALFARMVAQQVDMAPGELVWMAGDVHLYLNHADLVAEQLARQPSGHPRLTITRRPESMFDYRIEDFTVEAYAPQGHISAPVAV